MKRLSLILSQNTLTVGRLIKNENIVIAGGYAPTYSSAPSHHAQDPSRFSVPSMVADLTEMISSSAFSLESLMFGGAPAPDSLPLRARQAFPTAVMLVSSSFTVVYHSKNHRSQGYGLTETNSVAVSFCTSRSQFLLTLKQIPSTSWRRLCNTANKLVSHLLTSI